MSLVDYQSSDESDAGVDNDSCTSAVAKNISTPPISFVIPSKSKESVKITIPSLKEFEDDDFELHHKKAKQPASSGLIGMLPPPKYARNSPSTFLPHAVSKKTKVFHVSSNVPSVLNAQRTTVTSNAKVLLSSADKFQEKHESDLDGEENNQAAMQNFFSLEEPKISAGNINVPETIPYGNSDIYTESSSHLTYTDESASVNNVKFQSAVESCTDFSSAVPDIHSGYNAAQERPEPASSSDKYLTDEGFLRLQGKRRRQEDINIIDVSADDQLTDSTRWLTKSLTEEKPHRPSMKKDQLPTQQQRRKHQITYLAFQAKEREQELRNQWSQNRLTKRETQAKYGF